MDGSSPFHDYKSFCKKQFGRPLFKVPIDLKGTCANRQDGHGCTFCPSHGNRAVQLGHTEGILEQIERSLSFSQKRYKAELFQLYFQTYSSSSLDFEEILYAIQTFKDRYSLHSVSFSARPDCFNQEWIKFLRNIRNITEVWIDLGIQTIHNQSLEEVKRGHRWEDCLDALDLLFKEKIKVVPHLIMGLPGENEAMMLQSIKEVASFNIDGIKIHNLHVLKGTLIEQQFLEGKLNIFSEWEYIELLIKGLRFIPGEIPLLRLFTDSLEEQCTAPKWKVTKGRLIELLSQQMLARGIRQGDKVGKAYGKKEYPSLKKVNTDDGTSTFFSFQYNEHYHTKKGALSEAFHKFINPCEFEHKKMEQRTNVLDICFGLGYNSLAAILTAQKLSFPFLDITCLEMNRSIVGRAAQLNFNSHPISLSWNDILANLYRKGSFKGDGFSLNMIWGDGRSFVSRASSNHRYIKSFDYIFLDAFSTTRNTELWSVEFFRALWELLCDEGCLVTYSASTPVRAGLIKAGFWVGETLAFGRERGGTIAYKKEGKIRKPLSERELFLIEKTSRGIPFSDISLCGSKKEILRCRQEKVTQWKEKIKD